MPSRKTLTLELLLEAIDRLQSGFAVYDGEFELLYVNRAARQQWPVMYEQLEAGVTRKEAMRQQILAQYPDAPEAKIDEFTEYAYAAMSSGEAREITTLDNKSVRTHHENLGETGIVGISIDLTELKRNERALKKAQQAAVAASEAKSQFLANMSHEIRTPLNGILGMAEALSREALPADQREKIDIILESGKTLLTILNDVLDLSKIEAGKLDIAPSDGDLHHTLQRLVALWRPIAEEKGLALTLRFAPGTVTHCQFDPVRVRQCVGNLLSNAIKFTERGQVSIEVRSDCVPTEGDETAFRVMISVADTGIGMSEAVQAKLFAAFSQADNSTGRRFGGTGLGLNISRSLARMMDGDLTVESAEGLGSTFHFTLVAKRPSALRRTGASGGRIGAPQTDLAWMKGGRILVVDDNKVNRQVAALFLKPFGPNIWEAESGRQTLDLLSREEFDLVLLDMRMPDMDGPETIAAIRQPDAPWRTVPVIALTADAMSDDRERYLAMGLDGYAAKPIDLNALISEIASVYARTKTRVETGQPSPSFV